MRQTELQEMGRDIDLEEGWMNGAARESIWSKQQQLNICQQVMKITSVYHQ